MIANNYLCGTQGRRGRGRLRGSGKGKSLSVTLYGVERKAIWQTHPAAPFFADANRRQTAHCAVVTCIVHRT